MSKVSFSIPYPSTPAGKKKWASEYGLNAYYAGKHWSKRQADAKTWHTLTVSAMNRSKVRKQPFEKPVVVTFFWNDRLDIDNHAVIGKMIVDAMKGRVIQDDNRRHLSGVCHFFHDENEIRVIAEEVT